MDTTTIIEIIGKLLAAFAIGLLTYLAPKMTAWFEANTDKNTQDAVQALVRSFARAAEQLLKEDDPTGEKRKEFVIEQLQALGIEITEAILNMIEGAVWEINTESRVAEGVPLLLDELETTTEVTEEEETPNA